MLLSIILAIVFISAFLVYASFSVASGVYVKAVCRVQTRNKELILTFDDGPHPLYTSQVLDVLKRYQVKAVFFVIGRNIAGNEELLKRMQNEGLQTGNHSFSHNNTFPLLGAKAIADDLLLCEQAMMEQTGNRVKWFRPPFGVTNPDIAKAARIRGYRVIGWSIRSLDTMYIDRDKIVRRVVSRLRPGAIILLHDHLPHTPYVLEQIILQATKRGYVFTSLPLEADSV